MGLVALVGAVGGCGGDERGRAIASQDAPAALPPGQVNDHGRADVTDEERPSVVLKADDFFVAPTFVQVAPGARVHVEVVNTGSTVHNIVIHEADLDVVLHPGQRSDATLVLDDGAAEYYCRFHRHQGMRGAIHVGGEGIDDS